MGAVAFLFDFRSKGFEQGGSVAEEKASGKPFCRRGNERSEAIDAGASDKIPSSGPENNNGTLVVPLLFFIYNQM